MVPFAERGGIGQVDDAGRGSAGAECRAIVPA